MIDVFPLLGAKLDSGDVTLPLVQHFQSKAHLHINIHNTIKVLKATRRLAANDDSNITTKKRGSFIVADVLDLKLILMWTERSICPLVLHKFHTRFDEVSMFLTLSFICFIQSVMF